MYNLFYMSLGVILLLSGRQLFSIFCAAAGFLAGFDFATYAYAGYSESFILTMGLIWAGVGMLMGILLPRFAAIVAGLAAGGVLAVHMLDIFAPNYSPDVILIVCAAGALIGGLFMVFAFDTAVILVSSLLGGLLIVSLIPVDPFVKLIILLLLTGLGWFIQGSFRVSHDSINKRYR